MSQTITSILLIDDDPNICNVFELVMQHHQIPYNIVNDARSALLFLEINDPTIVLIDIFLPDMDGYQVLTNIRERLLSRDCKIVATTAYYTIDSEDNIKNHGFDGFLPKPIDPNNLVKYLESIVN